MKETPPAQSCDDQELCLAYTFCSQTLDEGLPSKNIGSSNIIHSHHIFKHLNQIYSETSHTEWRPGKV